MVYTPLAAPVSVLCAGADDRGFHLDGLADTRDGVFSARSRDRMLEIMRDSRLGTHGGLALIFSGTGKDSGVKRVGSAWRIDPCIAGGSMCGQLRTAALLMYRHRYARKKGLAMSTAT